jgi:hypothetical protein
MGNLSNLAGGLNPRTIKCSIGQRHSTKFEILFFLNLNYPVKLFELFAKASKNFFQIIFKNI